MHECMSCGQTNLLIQDTMFACEGPFSCKNIDHMSAIVSLPTEPGASVL